MGTFGVVSTETGESGKTTSVPGLGSREKTVAARALPGIRKKFLRGEGRGRERSQKHSTYSAPSKTPTLES